MNSHFPVMLSPCTGVCCMDECGRCEGCYRTRDEIAGWSTMGDDERLRLIEDVLPLRETGQE